MEKIEYEYEYVDDENMICEPIIEFTDEQNMMDELVNEFNKKPTNEEGNEIIF